MFQILIVIIVLPFLGALLAAPCQAQKADRVAAIFAGAVLVAGLGTVICSWSKVVYYPLGQLPWLPLKHPLFGVAIDGLSALMLLAITVVGFLVVLYSAGYLSKFNLEHPSQEGKGRYYFFLLLFIGAMVGLVLSPNFLQMLIFWELTTLCSWALISFLGNRESLAAGYKALLITHAAGLFFVAAILVIFHYTGSFEFSALRELPAGVHSLVLVFLFIAAAGKAAQFPLFTWLPTAMAAPTPASAYLHAAAMVKAGVYLTARVLVSGGTVPFDVAAALGGVAILTMYIGLIFYFFQDDLKRLLAFSTIANLSYMMLGLALGAMGSKLALEGGLLHLINHSFTKSLLFLAVGAISCATGTRKIPALSGLAKKMPITSLAFIIGALAISGVPPFGIFWSKYLIITGALELGSTLGIFLAVLVLLESVAGFACFLKVVHRVFFGEVSPSAELAKDPPAVMLVPLLVLIVLSVIAPYFSLPLISKAIGGLF
ncbi:hydrogenase 4 subunit D [Dehalobacter sp. DCM]|uniref:hydrogenase 4 subunit D n=1 Tax=Dehalobacter sp. DCM TaxID=2907827 RepID=UPI00308154DF|nr:hydrogenase 4 subunit D [Dehalobacter sp. DCM]